jgi:hypothetical protein
MVTKKVVTAREAFSVAAPNDMTVVGDLGGGLLHVLPLVTNEVLRVEKPLIADWASVRSLVTTEVNLEMAIQFALAVKCFIAALDTAKISIPSRWMPYNL